MVNLSRARDDQEGWFAVVLVVLMVVVGMVCMGAIHCKKELAIFPSPAGMSLTKLYLGGKKLNYSRPGRV